MRWWQRLGTATKRLASLVFPGHEWWRGPWYWGRTRFDYANQQIEPRGNSAVMACVGWVARNFPEAPIQVVQLQADGTRMVRSDHPLAALLERPNPAYAGPLLWHATVVEYLLGDAYWLVLRTEGRRPTQLWWLPSTLMEPKWPEDGSEFITHYEYKPNTETTVRLELDEVVHFRCGFDPDNPRKGLGPLRTALREIATDDEAANYTATILRNLGVPGVIISPDGDGPRMQQDEADRLKTNFVQKFGGDRRGEPLVLQGRMRVEMVSFSPEQMALRDLRRIPEERISALLGIPAVVAGLGAGLDRSTYNNVAEAREAAYENCIIPMQRLLAAELQTQLLPRFGDARRLRVLFDLSQVRVLQEDQRAIVEREAIALRAGAQTVNEFRTAIGKPEVPEGEVYMVPANLVPVPKASLATPSATPSTAVPDKRALPAGHKQTEDDIGPADVARARRFWQDAMAGSGLEGLLDAEVVGGNGRNGHG